MSDASDSHAYIYKADGQFQYVKDFEFTEEEKTTSSRCRELLAVKKTLQESPSSSQITRVVQCIGKQIQRIVIVFSCAVQGSRKFSGL